MSVLIIYEDGSRFDFNKYHGPDGRFAHGAGFAGPLTPAQLTASIYARAKAGEAPSSGLALQPTQKKGGIIDLKASQENAIASTKHKLDAATSARLTQIRDTLKVDTGEFLRSFDHMPTPGYIRAVPMNGGGLRVTGSGSGWKMERTFQLRNNFVEHDYFELEPQYQRQGIAKKVLRQQVASYRTPDSGISKVHVSAALTAGGYAWAKFGFRPVKGNRGFDLIIDKGKRENPTEAQSKLLEHLKKKGPTGIGTFAETAYGKKVLTGSVWDGVLDLKNTASMRRFDAYTAEK